MRLGLFVNGSLWQQCLIGRWAFVRERNYKSTKSSSVEKDLAKVLAAKEMQKFCSLIGSRLQETSHFDERKIKTAFPGDWSKM
ncbi:hypothetical protein [Schlesneria sp. T3-172]|uniref:hypothetical protein n=1 Tax=Schlesneria sphaerica TaxID=3373610 RepID=UPI0037C6C9FA